MTGLSFLEQGPAGGGRPEQLVMLIHGYGANAQDLIDLADLFAPHLPDAHFIAPNAPDACEIAPIGLQWFSLTDDTLHQRWLGTNAAAPKLNAFIDEQLDRFDLMETSLALVGFSQGTMMALHVGLRRGVTPAGLLGYSGMLVGGDKLPSEITSWPPIRLIHGTLDSVVPIEASRQAHQILEDQGLTVELVERPGLDHGIDAEGIREGAEFLVECFNPEP